MKITCIIFNIADKIGNFHSNRCGNQSSSKLFSTLVMILKEICTITIFGSGIFTKSPPPQWDFQTLSGNVVGPRDSQNHHKASEDMAHVFFTIFECQDMVIVFNNITISVLHYFEIFVHRIKH